MTEQIQDEVVRYLLERAGDRLRSVVRYGADASEVLFLRGDETDEDTAARLRNVVEEYRAENARTGRIEYHHGDVGRLNCVVRTFEDGVEMHFVTGDEEGVVVALDPDAATNLHDFVDDCLDHLDVDR